jgi:hypothetical protein
VGCFLLFLIWIIISWQIFQCFVSLLLQCSGSVTFWYESRCGSGSVPSAPDPALFVNFLCFFPF